MNFRGVLSREAANILVVLTGQLKQKGISVDLKAIDTLDSLLQMARVFNEPELTQQPPAKAGWLVLRTKVRIRVL